MSWQTKKAISLIDVLPKDKLLKSPKFSPLNQFIAGYGACSSSLYLCGLKVIYLTLLGAEKTE